MKAGMEGHRVLAKVASTGLIARLADETPVADHYELLVDLLAQTGAGGRIPLFAEPQPIGADGTRRWTTSLEGPIRRFGDLDKAERQSVQRRLAADRRAIEAGADLLEAGRRPKDAAILRAALASPGTAALFLVGDQPVLVAWGHDRVGGKKKAPEAALKPVPAATPEDSPPSTGSTGEPSEAPAPTVPVVQEGPAPAKAPDRPDGIKPPRPLIPSPEATPDTPTEVGEDAPPPRHRPWWTRRKLAILGWIASAILFAALLLRLLGACPPWIPTCGTDPVARLAMTEAEESRQQLQGGIRQAQARLADLTCPAGAAPSTDLTSALPPAGTSLPSEDTAVAPGPAPSIPSTGSVADGSQPTTSPSTEPDIPPTSPVPRFSLPTLSPDRFDARLQAAGAGEALAQTTLLWEGDADLDLALICPNGDQVAWNVPSACGWRMDLEANGMAPLTDTPVENIIALDPAILPPGRYQVAVTAFLARSAQFDPIGYAVRVQIGDRRLVGGGSIRQGDPSDIALTFDLPLD